MKTKVDRTSNVELNAALEKHPAVQFIRKYSLPLTLGTFQEVQCGLHSGFPECCILFWVTCGESLRFPDDDNDDDDDRRWPNYQDVLKNVLSGENRVGYVPCPRCLIEREFVQVKSCKKGREELLCRPV